MGQRPCASGACLGARVLVAADLRLFLLYVIAVGCLPSIELGLVVGGTLLLQPKLPLQQGAVVAVLCRVDLILGRGAASVLDSECRRRSNKASGSWKQNARRRRARARQAERAAGTATGDMRVDDCLVERGPL